MTPAVHTQSQSQFTIANYRRVVEICTKVAMIHSSAKRREDLGQAEFKTNLVKCAMLMEGVCKKVIKAFDFEGTVPKEIAKLQRVAEAMREQAKTL